MAEPGADNYPSPSQATAPQPLAMPLTGVRTYRGWMYLGEPVTPTAAAAMRPSEVISLPGIPIATAHGGRLSAETAVVFAIYGTALDLSELEGLPCGSVLFLDGARKYQITGTPGTTPPATIRITLLQR